MIILSTKIIGIKEAAKITKVSPNPIINYCKTLCQLIYTVFEKASFLEFASNQSETLGCLYIDLLFILTH